MMMRPASGTKSAKSINGRVRAAYNASYNAMLGKYKKRSDVLYPPPLDGVDFFGLLYALLVLSDVDNQNRSGSSGRSGVMMVNVSVATG